MYLKYKIYYSSPWNVAYDALKSVIFKFIYKKVFLFFFKFFIDKTLFVSITDQENAIKIKI